MPDHIARAGTAEGYGDRPYRVLDDVESNMLKASHPCYGGDGLPLVHSWEKGTCQDCGVVCEHEYEDGECQTCGNVCTHENPKYGWDANLNDPDSPLCTKCGAPCEHDKGMEEDNGRLFCAGCGLWQRNLERDDLDPNIP